MLKVLTAYTYELDDPQKAVQEILDQIDIKNGLLKNSAAMLFCHFKFIEMGVMEAVCRNLPFDVLGCTSMYLAAPAGMGDIMLSLMVLTSDDTEFAAGICDPLTAANTDAAIHALYKDAAGALGLNGAKPDLAFAFPPTILNLTIDTMTAALDNACGGAPVFGTVALDMDVNIRNPRTIYRGVAYDDRLALLLLKGPVKPRFFAVHFPEKAVQAQDAVITSAEGSEVFTINNMSAALFLQDLGLIQESRGGFSSAIPLVVEESEGSGPEVVVVQNIAPDGSLHCSRKVPVGGVISIGAITADYILTSARTLFHTIQENQGGTGLLVFSCFLRSIVLGKGAVAEVELLQQELKSYAGSWLYCNSGGELCPMHVDTGDTVNQALQYALVACQF